MKIVTFVKKLKFKQKEKDGEMDQVGAFDPRHVYSPFLMISLVSDSPDFDTRNGKET